MANPASARYKAMQKLTAKGWTLQAIGEKYGLCRERVRQIVGNVGRERQSTGIKKLNERMAEVLALWAQGATFSAITRATGVPYKNLRTLHLSPNAKPWIHGTVTCYQYHRCRCAECRAASAKRSREFQHNCRKKGLCVQCGKESADTWRCAACARHNADAKKRAKKNEAKAGTFD